MDTIFSLLKDISIEENIKIYVTGKYLRDFLLGKKTKDMELLVSDKTPIVAKDFSEKIDMKLIEGSRPSHYKVLDIDRDLRIDFHPVEEGDINKTLQRKGITIDSMAVDICHFEDDLKNNIIDPTGGLVDIENNIIKIWDEEVLMDNPILGIKAVGLMSELGFEMDKDTITTVKRNKGLIPNIEGKELRDEFFKILRRRKTYYYFSFMDKELGILEEIFPEIESMKDVGECKYHVVDAFTHSLYVLKLTENIIYYDRYFEDHIRKTYENHAGEKMEGDRTRIELIKLGAFFHDVGKPSARKVDSAGRVRFKGHEITGAEIIKEISERFDLSIKERDILYRIVAKHMLPLVSYKSNDVSSKFLYKMFKECGNETLDILLIALSDIVGTRKLLYPDEEMGKFKIHIEFMANNYITRYKETEDISDVIKGSDIIKEFDLPEEILASKLIEEVKKAIYMGKIGMNRNSVMKYLKDIL
ncbi:HD domain-containing protein [Clostridium sp. D2Q-11]|uniref:HD domain-containing protein n=1 Tax=Anaeromonas frigoriresistens TaxID=2683708 RepID=A0A942Z6T3_9FIRM|nr:HD domain-containing protein [Anaeromonas frigoriresistens]MBS4537922.1 HD domain-containing protein [Anaeromonas frigoriresistens]